jgi:hypothetical protein
MEATAAFALRCDTTTPQAQVSTKDPSVFLVLDSGSFGVVVVSSGSDVDIGESNLRSLGFKSQSCQHVVAYSPKERMEIEANSLPA